jgi:hypothetical protein
MRTMRSIDIYMSLLSVLLLCICKARATQACGRYQLNFLLQEDRSCASTEDFAAAYEAIYKGLQSYLELRAFSQGQAPLQVSLQDLAANSQSELDRVVSYDNDVRISGTGLDGSFALLQGDHLQPLETELPLPVGSFSCPAVEDCLEYDWCTSLCTHHCLRRVQHVRRTSQQAQESVCEWISRQTLPGCLQSSTLVCQLQQQLS